MKPLRSLDFEAPGSTFGAFSPDTPLRPSLLLVFALAALAGCDAFGEPERFYNDDAQPPAAGALDLADVRDGQHVAGPVAVALDLDSLAGRVGRVALWVDGQEVESRTGAPFEFTLDTSRYPDGEHTVSAAVYVRESTAGLLGLVGAPAVALSARLVFDQRPPTPVAQASAEIEGDRVRVRWAANDDPNFYAYLVVRSAPWTAFSGGPDRVAVVDTLYDQAATDWLDAPFPYTHGVLVEYDVWVWNRAQVSGSAGPLRAVYGTEVRGLYSPTETNAAAFSADGQTVYVAAEVGLVAVAAADHRQTAYLGYDELSRRSRTLPTRLELGPGDRELWAATDDGDGASRVTALDAATLRPERSFSLPDGATTFAVGAGGEVYAAGGGRLSVLDGQTGRVTARSEATFGPEARVADVSPDGRSVYVVDYTPGDVYRSPATLHRVDVAGAAPRSVATFEWARPDASWLTVADDGRLYAYTGTDSGPKATVLDGRSLAVVREVPLDVAGGWVASFVVAAGRIYVSVPTYRPDGRGGTGVVSEHDLSGRRLRSWDFAVPVWRLRTSGAGWLYVDQPIPVTTTWAVPL